MTLHVALCTETPVGLGWLTGAERGVHAGLREGPRQDSWLLGRWTAKQALGAVSSLNPSETEILASPDGAPESSAGSISIAHRGGTGLAVAGPPGLALGCDIELIEPRSPEFVQDYFLPDEQIWARQSPEPDMVANLIWCGKEAALKVARTGLRRDTRTVWVGPAPRTEVASAVTGDAFMPLDVFDRTRDTPVHAAWLRTEQWVVVLAAAQPFDGITVVR